MILMNRPVLPRTAPDFSGVASDSEVRGLAGVLEREPANEEGIV
jgi:hypothetical protein